MKHILADDRHLNHYDNLQRFADGIADAFRDAPTITIDKVFEIAMDCDVLTLVESDVDEPMAILRLDGLDEAIKDYIERRVKAIEERYRL